MCNFNYFFFFWDQFNCQFKNIECDSTNSAKVTLSKELKIEKTRGKFNIYEETVKEREREREAEKNLPHVTGAQYTFIHSNRDWTVQAPFGRGSRGLIAPSVRSIDCLEAPREREKERCRSFAFAGCPRRWKVADRMAGTSREARRRPGPERQCSSLVNRRGRRSWSSCD